LSGAKRALDGEGQVALIIGEAGIGKSRRLQRFHEQLGGTPHSAFPAESFARLLGGITLWAGNGQRRAASCTKFTALAIIAAAFRAAHIPPNY
jgi:hypothetical protein